MEYTWEDLERQCKNCKRCKLSSTRTNVVIGSGNRKADILFIGEGPGHDEDKQGLPFVGAAGQLLDRMLSAIDLERNEVYIANIVKCRPPNNRDPQEDEQQSCLYFLRRQLILIKPKIIVCLGRIAAKAIIDRDFKITTSHGTWVEKKGYLIIATYHPAALLRDESKKRAAWEDLKKIKKSTRKGEIN